MAEAAVEHLIGRLSSLILEEGKLLVGVGRDVAGMKDDLETMRSFLKEVDSRGDQADEQIKTWVLKVRDMVYDAEDVLDEFLLRLVQPCKHGILNYLLHKLHFITQLRTRRRLATEIRDIKARLKAISETRKALSEGIISTANTTPNARPDPRTASLYINEAAIVGIGVSKNKLLRCLTEGEPKLQIISVVGMGGLGKTTLVKKVYDSQMVKKHFHCHAWIDISESPAPRDELLRRTIKGVLKAMEEQALKEMDKMNFNDLIDELQKQLRRKRYVIIFDDIWNKDVWEHMEFAFPNCDNGSRIVFTTRTHNIVTTCRDYDHYDHYLEPLEEQDAWRLFCMKAFESNHDNSSCPEELKEPSQNILKKCKGLPLAIVLIGGLLARKNKTVLEWNNVHDSVVAEMRNGKLESLGTILLLSYNSLPYYLKPCFLYLSMFPEDHFIKKMTLIRLWIAEGFVEDKRGSTKEVVAGEYVNEFISRSMIQIAELSTDDSEVKSCRIHDLMRETVQQKSKEEYFSTTILDSQGMEAGLQENARRLSIYHNTCENNYSMGSRCSHIRSLMMFPSDESRWSFRHKFFRAFRLLRALDLEGAKLVEFPPELVELIHLRYLSLRSTQLTMLPKSIGKLKMLETLDLKYTGVCELPVEILKLQHLRHLLIYRYESSFDTGIDAYGVSVPAGIGNLTCLQKLALVDVGHQDARNDVLTKELGMLTQLRRLGITNLRSKDERDLCFSLEKMRHLSSLNLMTVRSTTTTDVIEFLKLDLLKSPPQFLRHLYLNGRLIRLPAWIASLRNLVILKLQNSRLSCEEGDPLKAFQHMPNLMCLILDAAYDGEELCCSEVNGYQNLKKLLFLKMGGLKRVTFTKGSMPMLRELSIHTCPALEMVPQGIEHLNALQELTLFRTHSGLVERIKKKSRSTPPQEAQGKGEDWLKVQHIPTIKHIFCNTQGNLVYANLQYVRN